MSDIHEVYALKYAERNARRRGDSFLFDDDHATPHPMDYYLWVIRNAGRAIVVDTGYDAAEGARRGRPILRDPVACLADFGIEAETVETVVITHLHYDHAGALDRFPNAIFHLQASEVRFATGPCMCHDAMRMPYTADHVCAMIRKVYSGRVAFHDGDAALGPGIEIVAIGGHSRGLQAVRVKTQVGWMLLASDASHYYENYLAAKLFPIVADTEAMLEGFARLPRLVSAPQLVVPGHDPLVRRLYPRVAGAAIGAAIHRLDVGPTEDPRNLVAGVTA